MAQFLLEVKGEEADPAFIDWTAGETLDPDERWADWHALVTEVASRGVEARRARVVSTPVSEYNRFEYEAAKGAAGEDVRWLSRRDATDIALPGNDFWLFDSSLVLGHHFDGEGENLESELTASSPHRDQTPGAGT